MTTKLSFDEFLDYACNKYKFKLPNNNNDIERALEYILNIFKEGKIGKINYEKE
jgi:ribosome biogenesis GTPase A